MSAQQTRDRESGREPAALEIEYDPFGIPPQRGMSFGELLEGLILLIPMYIVGNIALALLSIPIALALWVLLLLFT